jgi:DNA-binding NarL/FixJ family response regulator
VTERFLLVEDDRSLARGLARHLMPFGEVVLAHTKHEAMQALRPAVPWRALIVDVTLPDGSGLDVLDYARQERYECPALVLTGSESGPHINRAFDLDARYLVKPCSIARIKDFARDAVARGSPQVDEYVSLWASRYTLTDAEVELLTAAAEGTTSKALADERGVALGTIKRHVHNLLKKTGDRSLVAATARLLREHLDERMPR